MILIDTSVLIALCDPSDAWSPRALEQLRTLRNRDLLLILPVLTETFHLLDRRWLRRRLIEWIARFQVTVSWPAKTNALAEVWQWLEKYEDHEPDFADACLIAACADKKSSVWTFDREFATIWRHLDGSRVRLAFPLEQ